MASKHKLPILITLSLLLCATISAGIYFKHYFVVFVFGVWILSEVLILRLRDVSRFVLRANIRQQKNGVFSSLISLFQKNTVDSDRLLEDQLSEMRFDSSLTTEQLKSLDQIRDLAELRKLVFRPNATGRKVLRYAFAYKAEVTYEESQEPFSEDMSLQDITESAVYVANLYRRAFEIARNPQNILSAVARDLSSQIYNADFDEASFAEHTEFLIDSMLRDSGVPFLMLNLLRKHEWKRVKHLGQRLLTSQFEIDEDIRSALYWITEIQWFVKEKTEPLSDYESCIRYLYHICFTNPERAGFLEIDSQFYSQFETVSELAREGFLFKENLIERILLLWREHEGYFDGVFQSLLEIMTQQRSKIYDERETWVRFWARESENFSRDYLYVVEGNICYSNGHFEDARLYYEKAYKLNPHLRPAVLNAVFAYAKLGLTDLHEWMVQKVLEDRTLMPSSLFVIGNSYLLLGQDKKAETYYEELKKQNGWHGKVDYYKSTFCFENGLNEKALLFARIAHDQNPSDTSISYHLSLCYNAVGEKDRALEMVRNLGEGPQWMSYYKFTLERDAGRLDEASETLLRIPIEYFDDPDELETALTFARDRKDFALLRHLRKTGNHS